MWLFGHNRPQTPYNYLRARARFFLTQTYARCEAASLGRTRRSEPAGSWSDSNITPNPAVSISRNRTACRSKELNLKPGPVHLSNRVSKDEGADEVQEHEL